MPATRLRVPVSREARIAAFDLAFQRCATGSPARWITASRPESAPAGAGPADGSQATASTSSASLAFPGLRESTVIVSPRALRAATSFVPMSPVAPVIVTFI